MTKAQHTPGPWRISGCQMGKKLLIEHGDTETMSPIICSVYTDEGRLPQAANAHLIAAAPDMLKLLREVLEWNEDDADLATNDTAFRLKNFADTVANRCAALRAAIAKAEG